MPPVESQREPKVALVTGARGFIGRHCLAMLRESFDQVVAVSSRPALPSSSGVRWHAADLLKSKEVDELMRVVRPTHLLHLAWTTEPGRFWTDTRNVRWLDASLHLAESFTRYGGRRLVTAGTCAEYDWTQSTFHETGTPLAPSTLYGASKHALRLAMESLAARARDGLSYAHTRIFHLYGPDEHTSRFVPSVIRSLMAGEPARCSSGEQIRDWLHVADVAEAHARLLASDLVGPCNIGSGRGVAVGKVALRIAKAMGREDLLAIGALAPRAGDPPLLVADVGRITDELGWRPRYDLDAGLRETIAWWRKAARVAA